MSRGSWVRRLRARYRSRSHELVVTAVVWWPSHPTSYRAIVRVTGRDRETGHGAGQPGEQPCAERVTQLVKPQLLSPRWVRQRLHERVDLDAFPACRSLTVVGTTNPPPAWEEMARVQIQRGPQARAGRGE
jgi:hypothetical protein